MHRPSNAARLSPWAARLAHPLSSHTGDLPARRIRHQGRDRRVRFGLVLNNPADEIVRRGLCRFEMFEGSLRPPNSQMRAMRVPLNVLVWRLAGGSRTTGPRNRRSLGVSSQGEAQCSSVGRRRSRCARFPSVLSRPL